MRINKRCILRAQKIKERDPYKKIKDLVNTIRVGFISSLSQLCDWIVSAAEWVSDTLSNYMESKREDMELFNTLPSLRRFEKDMI